jgi:hypothetical protein
MKLQPDAEAEAVYLTRELYHVHAYHSDLSRLLPKYGIPLEECGLYIFACEASAEAVELTENSILFIPTSIAVTLLSLAQRLNNSGAYLGMCERLKLHVMPWQMLSSSQPELCRLHLASTTGTWPFRFAITGSPLIDADCTKPHVKPTLRWPSSH